MSSDREDAGPDGGDPVCWLAATCAECGALIENATCWRCGAPRDEERAGVPPA